MLLLTVEYIKKILYWSERNWRKTKKNNLKNIAVENLLLLKKKQKIKKQNKIYLRTL